MVTTSMINAAEEGKISSEAATSYKTMRADCSRLDAAPDLLAQLEFETQGLHKALDALRVITNGAQ